MKKALLFIFVIICFCVQAQEKFRLSDSDKKEIKKINSEVLSNILIVENLLDKREDPLIGTIKQSINSSRLSPNQISKIENIVCISCYENEWVDYITTKKEIEENQLLSHVNNPEFYDIKQLNNMDSIQVLRFIKEVENLQPEKKFKAVRVSDYFNSNDQLVILMEERLTQKEVDEAFKKLDIAASSSYLDRCPECIFLSIKTYLKGANKDLEIEGIPTYKMIRLEGKYLNIYPFWQKYFAPDTTAKSLLEDKSEDNKRFFEDRIIGLKFRITRNGDYWIIYNNSTMFGD